MENVHAERSAGWSALCFVAVLVVSGLLTGSLPSIATKPADLALFFDMHRAGLLWGAWLTLPAAALFLWFLVGLRAYLRQAPGRQEGLPVFAMLAGVVIVAQTLVGAALQSALAYAPPEIFVSNGLAAAYVAMTFVQNGLGYAPIAIFLFAAAHSMRRHQSAPAWLAWLGYAAAVGSGLATLSIFFGNPFLAPQGAAALIFGPLLCLVWLIATGIVLVRTKTAAAA
jgi:hypothetical protein